tara:strand:- start:624 stop:1058 length:435 start_codon:yes stop_codon:yes gene_type:complete
MNWFAVFSVGLLATFKFMFAPFTGTAWDLSFIETYIICVIGGTTSSAFFFYFSKLLMFKLKAYRLKKQKKQKKVFTKTNKWVVWIKIKFGMIGICFWAPFFFSVPLGSIIVAKFYGKKKVAFFLIFLGMNINAFITTGLAYFIF